MKTTLGKILCVVCMLAAGWMATGAAPNAAEAAPGSAFSRAIREAAKKAKQTQPAKPVQPTAASRPGAPGTLAIQPNSGRVVTPVKPQNNKTTPFLPGQLMINPHRR